jgi:hypothetical protein
MTRAKYAKYHCFGGGLLFVVESEFTWGSAPTPQPSKDLRLMFDGELFRLPG